MNFGSYYPKSKLWVVKQIFRVIDRGKGWMNVAHRTSNIKHHTKFTSISTLIEFLQQQIDEKVMIMRK